ncbi:MAG: hypothetical protein IJE46_06355 [Clostridia bacterium]|nr:hypothetical protein [Clostridia bacterium]
MLIDDRAKKQAEEEERKAELERIRATEERRRKAEEERRIKEGKNMWQKTNRHVGSTYENRPNPMLTRVFYDSSYACPFCGKPMYKTVFPVGREYPIKVNMSGTAGNAYMKRVFTCPDCRYFATAAISRLSDGTIYEKKVTSNDEYNRLLNALSLAGTTQGRPD